MCTHSNIHLQQHAPTEAHFLRYCILWTRHSCCFLVSVNKRNVLLILFEGKNRSVETGFIKAGLISFNLFLGFYGKISMMHRDLIDNCLPITCCAVFLLVILLISAKEKTSCRNRRQPASKVTHLHLKRLLFIGCKFFGNLI